MSGGLPYFTIFLDGRYVEPKTDQKLEANRWYHLAGVYDGDEVRLYVDGKLVASESASGERKTNDLSLMIGADVDGRNLPRSFFPGWIDTVRLSSMARYHGETFEPVRDWEPDDDTQLLIDHDLTFGPFVVDRSRNSAHAVKFGSPEFVDIQVAP